MRLSIFSTVRRLRIGDTMKVNRSLLVLLTSFGLAAAAAGLLSVYFSRTYTHYERSIADLERERRSLSKQLGTLQSDHELVQAAYKTLTENSVKICMADLRSTSDLSCEQVAKAVLADKRVLADVVKGAYFETIGARYMRQNLFASAAGWFEKALEIDANAVNANVLLAYALFREALRTAPDHRQRLLEKALTATDVALAGQAANSYAIINRLKVLCALNRPKDAQSFFEATKASHETSEAVSAIRSDVELKRTCRNIIRL